LEGDDAGLNLYHPPPDMQNLMRIIYIIAHLLNLVNSNHLNNKKPPKKRGKVERAQCVKLLCPLKNKFWGGHPAWGAG